MEVVRDLTAADAATQYFAGRLDGIVPTGQIRVLHIADTPAAGPPTRTRSSPPALPVSRR
jgi:hypothetical protein